MAAYSSQLLLSCKNFLNLYKKSYIETNAAHEDELGADVNEEAAEAEVRTNDLMSIIRPFNWFICDSGANSGNFMC